MMEPIQCLQIRDVIELTLPTAKFNEGKERLRMLAGNLSYPVSFWNQERTGLLKPSDDLKSVYSLIKKVIRRRLSKVRFFCVGGEGWLASPEG
jgi:hypothetical protein